MYYPNAHKPTPQDSALGLYQLLGGYLYYLSTTIGIANLDKALDLLMSFAIYSEQAHRQPACSQVYLELLSAALPKMEVVMVVVAFGCLEPFY